MSVADMVDIENQIGEVVDAFEEKMKILFEEDPGLFAGRSTKGEWHCQVTNAGLELVNRIAMEIERVETKLHNGEFYEELRTWQREAGCSPQQSA